MKSYEIARMRKVTDAGGVEKISLRSHEGPTKTSSDGNLEMM
jgi:hypothetical protein